MRPRLVTAGVLLAATIGLGCTGAVTPATNPTPHNTSAGYTDGQYAVGSEIRPGTYVTTVPDDRLFCYWARMAAFNADPDSVLAARNLGPGTVGRLTVKRSDAGVLLAGGCKWVRS